MSENKPNPHALGEGWSAFTLLLSGVVFYGGIGWLLDTWLDITFFVPVGMLGGMAAGLYMVYKRFFTDQI